MKKEVCFLILLLILCSVVVCLPLVSANAGSWETMEHLPVALGGVKAAAVNGKIYVMKSNFTLQYDIDSWFPKTGMPTPRGDFGMTAYQDKIYVIGGLHNNTETGVNEVYDPVSDSWVVMAEMPTPRHGLDANVVDGKIYLIGGLIPLHPEVPNSWSYKSTGVTEVYDPVTNSWTTGEAIPYPVSHYSSAVLDDKIYVVSENLTQIYDPATDAWSLGTPLPYRVDMAGGAATTGVLAPPRIYVLGGREGGLEVDYNQVYDPTEDSWSLGTDMPTPRYAFGVAVVDDQIYTIGGLTGAFVGTQTQNQNERYAPAGWIPEFPTWLPMLMLTVVLTVTVVIYTGRTRKI